MVLYSTTAWHFSEFLVVVTRHTCKQWKLNFTVQVTGHTVRQIEWNGTVLNQFDSHVSRTLVLAQNLQKVWSVGGRFAEPQVWTTNLEPRTTNHEAMCEPHTANLWCGWSSSRWSARGSIELVPLSSSFGKGLYVDGSMHSQSAVAPHVIRWAGAISVPAMQWHYNNMHITCFFGFFGIPVGRPGPWFELTDLSMLDNSP